MANADDTIMYMAVTSEDDASLQKDLDGQREPLFLGIGNFIDIGFSDLCSYSWKLLHLCTTYFP